MSLKPIEPKHFASDDVDPGVGTQISNKARAMNHYSMSQGTRRAPSTGNAADLTGGMRAYAPHDAKKPRDKRKTAGAIVIVVVLIAAITAALGLGISSCSKEIANNEIAQSTVTLTIPNGYGSGDIAQLLRDKGVIANTTDFIKAVQQHGAGSSLKAGTYTFDAGMTNAQIVEELVAGPESSGVNVLIPEGFTVAQTAQRLSDALNFSYDEFMAQAKASYYVADYPFLSGAYNDSLEGFLFPKTYNFAEGVGVDTVVRAMLDQYQRETANLDWSLATQGETALNQYQVVTMASLIERETAQESERPIVASVMFNRLNVGMQLQIDAAIAYALNKSDLLTWDDLQVESEYNTYTHYGLTPGPICSPSLSSIQAVLNAEVTDYYFYVASPALDGTHVFCTTYEEFEEAVADYNVAAGIA